MLSRIYLLAAVILIAAPVAVLVIWSFAGRWAWPDLFPESFSLRGMEELFGPHSQVIPILLSSIALSMAVALLSAAIGAMTAKALTQYEFRGKKLIAFGSILPILVPGTAFAMGIQVVFIRMGLADTLAGVILVHLIYALPYTINFMTDTFSSIGSRYEQQAQVLGASGGKTFAYVTLPMIMPGLLSSVSLGYLISFSQYFITLMIGGGAVKTMSVVMVPFIQGSDRTIASAYVLLFVVSAVAVFILLEWLAGRIVPKERKLRSDDA